MTLIHAVAHPGSSDDADGDGLLPTLIALHGYGANAQDLLGLSPYLAGGRLLMICPQAPLQIEPNFHGFNWHAFSGPDGRGSPEVVEAANAMVSEFVDFALEAYPVRRDRVALLGFSQGGGMAYRAGFHEPQRYAGLAALSTGLPDDVFADGEAPGAAVRALPLLVQHGASDASVERRPRTCLPRPPRGARAGARLSRVPDGARGWARTARGTSRSGWSGCWASGTEGRRMTNAMPDRG